MIKIDRFFKNDIIEEYWQEIQQSININNYSITFFSSPDNSIEYSIPIRLLLYGQRSEVLNHPGINIYCFVCHMQKYTNLSCSELSERLNYDYDISPPLKTSERNKNGIDYIFKQMKSILPSQVLNQFSFKERTLTQLKRILHTLYNDYCNVDMISKKIDYTILSSKMRSLVLCSLNIKCCPYCNRQYITSWTKDTNQYISADLDHFYPKSVYPLFVLSLFNFVPSCQICNSSRMKGSIDTDLVYPYEEGFDSSACFRVEQIKKDSLTDAIELFLAKTKPSQKKGRDSLKDDYRLAVNISDAESDIDKIKRIKNNFNVFNIESVYGIHLDDAIELILKIRVFLDGSYCNEIQNVLRNIGMDCQDLFSEDDIYKIILGIDSLSSKDLDRPLSKMFHDIYENEMVVLNYYDD